MSPWNVTCLPSRWFCNGFRKLQAKEDMWWWRSMWGGLLGTWFCYNWKFPAPIAIMNFPWFWSQNANKGSFAKAFWGQMLNSAMNWPKMLMTGCCFARSLLTSPVTLRSSKWWARKSSLERLWGKQLRRCGKHYGRPRQRSLLKVSQHQKKGRKEAPANNERTNRLGGRWPRICHKARSLTWIGGLRARCPSQRRKWSKTIQKPPHLHLPLVVCPLGLLEALRVLGLIVEPSKLGQFHGALSNWRRLFQPAVKLAGARSAANIAIEATNCLAKRP